MSAKDEAIVQFVEMTGSDPATAIYFLEMSNYDIETALNLMFSGDIPPPPPSSNNINKSSSSEVSRKDGNQSSRQEQSHSQVPFPSFDNFDTVDSIRKADEVVQQTLLDYSTISHTSSQRFNAETAFAFSRAEDQSVEWMFPPPNHLSYPGTLSEARALAKKDKKWILINIQCAKEFSSHLLNRDVWTNETLISLIRMNFIFWQRGRTSQDGEMFISMHRIGPDYGGDHFPLIGIVDTRTGALISKLKVTGRTEANEIILKLMEFLESNDINKSQAPVVDSKVSHLPISNSMLENRNSMSQSDNSHGEDSEVGDEDDEEEILNLAAALKESLKLSQSTPHSSSLAKHTATTTATTTSTTGNTKADSDCKVDSSSQVAVTEDTPSLYANSITLEDTREPNQEEAGSSVKISLKLAPEVSQAIAKHSGGKPVNALVRSFHGDRHTVQHVYAAVYFLIQECAIFLPAEFQKRSFDLLTAFPRQSLDGKRDMAVSAAGLKGAQVIMLWV